MGDQEATDAAEQPDRSKVVKNLLKQVENPDNPFDVRHTAVHAVRVELAQIEGLALDLVQVVEDTDNLFHEAKDAQGTDAYRGMVSALSPKTKGGQQILQKFKQAVLTSLKPPKAPKSPVEPRAKKSKDPQNDCVCGCGTKVHNLFAPGHDAKVHGILLKVSRGQQPQDTIPAGVLPHIKDFCIKWGIPTDDLGDMIIAPPKVAEPGAVKETSAQGA